jgi:hypothetical protein
MLTTFGYHMGTMGVRDQLRNLNGPYTGYGKGGYEKEFMLSVSQHAKMTWRRCFAFALGNVWVVLTIVRWKSTQLCFIPNLFIGLVLFINIICRFNDLSTPNENF